MVSRKMYILVILALLNSCSPTITVNPQASPSATPSVIMTSTSPAPLINSSSSPLPVATSTPIPIPSNLSTLSVAEVKQITDSSIVKADNTFGIKLFLDMIKQKNNENIFISTASVALALQMVYNGANGSTRDEMSKALEIEDLSLENLNHLNKLLIQKINTPASDIKLEVANSLWADKRTFTFKDEYKNNLINYYQAETKELDLLNLKLSTKNINDWVFEKTKGKIEKILDVIPSEEVGYLINAIYFKADWTRKFEKNQTESREFTLTDGTKKNVQMMSDFRSFKYFNKIGGTYNNQGESTLGFQGAELTYGKEGKISLIMFLPDSLSSLEKFYSQLNEKDLENWLSQFYTHKGYISFPKFKIEWNKEISDNLKNLGIINAFQDNANFSKMGDEASKIRRILHKTYVDVNEEGTEAAAVTAVETTTPSSSPTKRFVADRPFLYIIRDNDTKSMLFMGAVNDPKYEN